MVVKIPVAHFLKEIKRGLRYLPVCCHIKMGLGVTNMQCARRLRNPFLKEAFELLFDGEGLTALPTMPLAFYDKKKSGIPDRSSASCR